MGAYAMTTSGLLPQKKEGSTLGVAWEKPCRRRTGGQGPALDRSTIRLDSVLLSEPANGGSYLENP